MNSAKMVKAITCQYLVPPTTTKKEMYDVFDEIRKHCGKGIESKEYVFWCCWFSMQYGRMLGIQEERRKKKKAAQRRNAERQANKPTKV